MRKIQGKSKDQQEALAEYFRVSAKWSQEMQEEIAEKLGMTVNQVYMWNWRKKR